MPPAPQFDPLGGSVAGSADLQSSIDRLDNAVVALTGAIQGATNGNGTITSSAMASQAAGATFTTGTMGAGNNGSGGTGGTNPYAMGGGGGGGTGGLATAMGGGFGLGQILANLGSSALNATAQAGNSQLNNQVLMNTYGYVQAGFWNVNSQSTIKQNFGALGGGGISSQNNLATSATDAFYGGNLLSQISGQANYTSPAGPQYGRGNAPYQAAAVTGLANPGLGMTGSASVSGALFNPNTSYNLMMMGVGTTPLQLGTGKANSLANVEASIGQRFNFGGYNSKTGTFNSQSLSANLDNPLFQYQMMQATGMNQQQFNEWSQTWAQANNWTQNAGGGVTMNQMQNEISQYMNGGQGQGAAQSWLTSHGVSQSALQQLTQANAGQTATESGTNQQFISGLSNATDAINRLTNLLSKIAPATAYAAGSAGGLSTLNAQGVSGAGGGGLSSSALATVNVGLADLGAGVKNLLSGLGISPASNVSPSGGNASGTNAQNEALGKKMAASYGWTGAQWTALNNVIMHESGWNSHAQNPTSTAYGIGQFLNTTWGEYDGITKSQALNNPQLQIKAMLDYVKGKYGNPENAWNGYFNRYGPGNNGYATGSDNTSPGYALVGERGPELVKFSGGQKVMNAMQTFNAVQAPWTTGDNARYMFGMGGSQASGGVTIEFGKGSVVISSGGGFHTSNDVNTAAAQFTQALEKSLMKSDILKKIASGVTG